MRQTALILLLAAGTVVTSAQTPVKPAAPAAKSAATTKPAATTAKPVVTVGKLPLGVPAPGIPAVTTMKKTALALQYQEIKVGTGVEAEPNKMYKIFYTGWRAADGVKFDSTEDHPRAPVLGNDGKPMLDPDGKPVQGPVQPINVPIGVGGTIVGFDQGFAGMKVGGKRRIFIPWQLAYGTHDIAARGPEHPGIPAKSDLIFDVELVGMSEMPPPQPRPGPGMAPGMHPQGARPGTPPAPGTPTAPPAPGSVPKPVAPPTPTASPAPASTPAPAPTPMPTQSASPAPTQPK